MSGPPRRLYVFEGYSEAGNLAWLEFADAGFGCVEVRADVSLDRSNNVIERSRPIRASVGDLRAMAKALADLADKIERAAPRSPRIVQLRKGQPYSPDRAPMPGPPKKPVNF